MEGTDTPEVNLDLDSIAAAEDINRPSELPVVRDKALLAARLSFMTELPPTDSRRGEIESFWSSILGVFEKRGKEKFYASPVMRTNHFGQSEVLDERVARVSKDYALNEVVFEMVNDLLGPRHFTKYGVETPRGFQELDYKKVWDNPAKESDAKDFQAEFWNPQATGTYDSHYSTAVSLSGGKKLTFRFNGKEVFGIEKIIDSNETKLVATPAFSSDGAQIVLHKAQGVFGPLVHSIAYSDTAPEKYAAPSGYRSPHVEIIHTSALKKPSFPPVSGGVRVSSGPFVSPRR